MKPWRDLSDSEKIDRLGSVVALLQHRMEKVDPDVPMSGYTILHIRQTDEQIDDWLPYFGGNLSKEKAA